MKGILKGLAGSAFLLAGAASAAEQMFVAGDSMSKEYQSEFVGLYPDNPDAWDARNWNEILDAERNSKCDLGSWQVYTDLRLTGHAYNFAKPGATSREYRNFLRQDQDAEDEITGSSGGNLVWPFFPSWRNTFNDVLSDSEKAVIFFGGNDLAMGNTDPLAQMKDKGGTTRQIEYGSIYDDTFADPALAAKNLRDSIRKNIRSIVQYFRNTQGYTKPIVLVAVPHVGITPKLKADNGTDAARTARITAMLDTLNTELQAMAAEFDCGFADVYTLTKKILSPEPFTIGGIQFYKTADDDCRVRYLFSGDGFHPNTPAQAKIAQIILDAFRTKYPATHGAIPRLSDREIIEDVLHLANNTGYKEWLASKNVPASRQDPEDDPDNDGVPNLLEYALAGRDPTVSDGTGTGSVSLDSSGPQTEVRLDYRPRTDECAYCDLIPEMSVDLADWTEVPDGSVTKNADGSVTVKLPVETAAKVFLRLAARVAP